MDGANSRRRLLGDDERKGQWEARRGGQGGKTGVGRTRGV